MKLKVVSHREDIDNIDGSDECLHVSFRPSNKDILIMAHRCENLKLIHIPGSYMKTISKSTLMFLEMKNIQIIQGDVWGHRSDINVYYEINPEVVKKVRELVKENKTPKQIRVALKDVKIPDEFIEVLMKI